MERNEAEAYITYLETMDDIALKTEWDRTDARDEKFLITQEMAKRFRKPSPQQLHYINKLLGMPEQFKDACCRKEWHRAMRIYNDAIAIGTFLEIPIHLRRELFGDDESKAEGMIPRRLVNRAYLECTGKDNPGNEMVSGETGLYGVKTCPGTRHMAAGEDPPYGLRQNTRDGQVCFDFTAGAG